MSDGRSYDQHQMDTDLVVCANCRRATYMRRPCYAICLACRTGAPPIGPVIPRVVERDSDISGVPTHGEP
jgi:hypothetical protein